MKYAIGDVSIGDYLVNFKTATTTPAEDVHPSYLRDLFSRTNRTNSNNIETRKRLSPRAYFVIVYI